MTVGSRHQALHREAILIYKVCHQYSIRLSVEWVSRDFNDLADRLSRVDDPDDYMLDPEIFKQLDQLWGPHTCDRFASMKTKQLPRFTSKFANPGCESIDAFTVSWAGENNWQFPPPHVVPRILRHMGVNGERGTLVIPYWPSAPWWPLLVTKHGAWQTFVLNSLTIPAFDGLFIAGSAASNVFTAGAPAFPVIALQLQFPPNQ